MKIIDAFFRPPVDAIVETGLFDSPGPTLSRYKRGQALDPAYLMKDPDLILREQRDLGVVASIVPGLAPAVGFDLNASLTGPMTEFPNEQVAAICDELDGFYGLASVNPADNPNAVDDLVRWLDHGMLGVMLYPGWFAEPSTATTRSSSPSTKPAPPATSPRSSCTAASPALISPTPTPSTSNASP